MPSSLTDGNRMATVAARAFEGATPPAEPDVEPRHESEIRPRGWVKRVLPRTMFGRSLLIVVIPLVVLQAIATWIFYDRHWAAVSWRLSAGVAGDIALLIEAMQALRRESKEQLWSSMIKDTMKRKKPSFNEAYHGYRTFSELLEDAAREGLLELETDKRSRTYVVTRFGAEMTAARCVAAVPDGGAAHRPDPRCSPGGRCQAGTRRQGPDRRTGVL